MSAHFRLRLLLGAVLVISVAGPRSNSALAQDAAAAAAAIDPEAMAALDRMGAALDALQRFSVVSDASLETVLDNGQKIEVDGRVIYQVMRPDHLTIELQSDRSLRQIYYDGTTLTVYAPALNYYASVKPQAKTLAALMTAARDKYGIEVPLADLFLWGKSDTGRDAIKSAMSLGPGSVDGEPVEHYAFRQQDIDWQLWLGKADALPRKIVIASLADVAQPEYSSRLHWDLKANPRASEFVFKPPKDAALIKLVPVMVAADGTGKEQ